MLPLDRYARLGATSAELDALQAEYDALPEPQQEIRDSHLASLSDGGLHEDLEARRARTVEPVEEAEPASDPEPEPEPEPIPDPAPEPDDLTLSDGSAVTE